MAATDMHRMFVLNLEIPDEPPKHSYYKEHYQAVPNFCLWSIFF